VATGSDTSHLSSWFPDGFFAGANLPWIDYGCDYGSNAWYPRGGLAARVDARDRLEHALDRLARDGLTVVRLFMLCDGRSGVRMDPGGAPVGLDDTFFRDADVAFGAARARGLRLLPVLFDFHLCRATEISADVQLGGRAAWLSDPHAREGLIEQVVRPLAERYGRDPAVAAWDLFNEPEWCTRPFALPWVTGAVPFETMRESLRLMTDCVRANTRQPITIGSAHTQHLELVRGLGLDLYQVHWYERYGWSALAGPVGRLDLDRPVLLGEFPGRTTRTTPGDVVRTAREAGYLGALVWSVLSPDSVSAYVEGLGSALGP